MEYLSGLHKDLGSILSRQKSKEQDEIILGKKGFMVVEGRGGEKVMGMHFMHV